MIDFHWIRYVLSTRPRDASTLNVTLVNMTTVCGCIIIDKAVNNVTRLLRNPGI